MGRLEAKREDGNYQWFGHKGEMRFWYQANADGSGAPLSSSRTAAVRFFADTGGLTTTGNIRNVLARTLIGTAQSAAGTITSMTGQLKTVANFTGSWAGGLWGYFESSGTVTLTPSNAIYGVRATVDVPSGTTIASGKYVAALVLDSVDMGGTHTGKAVAIYARSAATGNFDAFLALDASSEFLTTQATGGTAVYLHCLIGGTKYTIEMDTTA